MGIGSAIGRALLSAVENAQIEAERSARYNSYDSDADYVRSNRSRYENGSMSDYEKSKYQRSERNVKNVNMARQAYSGNCKQLDYLEQKVRNGTASDEEVVRYERTRRKVEGHERRDNHY